MFKKIFVICFAVVAMFALQPVEKAEAKVRVHIGIGGPGGYYGGPYYGGGYQPYYRPRYYAPRPYYGGYNPRRHRYAPTYRPRRVGRLNCRQARRVVRNRGYRNIRSIDCRGRRFTFHAIKRGRWYRVRMNSRNGRLFGIRRL